MNHEAASTRSGADVRLCECIELCKGISDWCTAAPQILQWCFSDETIAEICGHGMLECWRMERDPDLQKHLKQFTAENINAVKVLMMLMTSSEKAEEYHYTFSLLLRLLTSDVWPSVCEDVKVLFRSYLPEFTHRGLLHQQPNSDEHLNLLLRLLCELKLRILKEALTTLDTKIVLQVCRLLGGSNEDEPHLALSDVCWNLLIIYLLQARIHSDDRVCSMVLAHPSLLSGLQADIVDKSARSELHQGISEHTLQPQLLLALTLMLNHISRLDLPNDSPETGFTLTLPLEPLVRPLLLTDSAAHTVSALMFWLAYLERGASATQNEFHRKDTENSDEVKPSPPPKAPLVVRLVRTGKGLHLGRGDGVGELSVTDIASMYIYLLQCIIKERPIMSDLAVACLDKLLCYASVNASIYSRLRNNKWTKIVLNSVCDSRHLQDLSQVSALTLNLVTTMVKHDIEFIQPYVTTVSSCLSNLAESLDQHTCLAYKHCLQQLTNTKKFEVASETKAYLEEILDNLQAMEFDYRSADEYIYLKSSKIVVNNLMDMEKLPSSDNITDSVFKE